MIVPAAAPHDHVGGRRLGTLGLLIRLAAPQRRLGKAQYGACDSPDIAAAVVADSLEQTLPCLLGKVGLLEDTLGAVEVWQVQDGARVAAVKEGRETHTGLQRLDHMVVDFVVDDVACPLMVDGVNDLVVAVLLVAARVFGLPAMSCIIPISSSLLVAGSTLT